MVKPSSSLRLELEEIIKLILHEPEEIALAQISRLREVLLKTVDGDLSLRKTDLPSGEAVSPYVAALCLNGAKRTLAFLKGNYAAICDSIERVKYRPVYFLDAGCGPLGSLSLPLATQFPSDRVRFIATDIHEESIRQIQDSLKQFSLYGHFERFIITDLTSYKHEGQPLDIITTETMGSSLLGEPQGSITANLAPQLIKDGIWTPERVIVRAYLATGDSKNRPKEVYSLGEIVDLKAGNTVQQVSADFDLPTFEESMQLYFGTRIVVYGENVIKEGESSITTPVMVPNGRINAASSKLHLEYKLGCSKTNILVQTS